MTDGLDWAYDLEYCDGKLSGDTVTHLPPEDHAIQR